MATIVSGLTAGSEEGANYLIKHAPRFPYPGSQKARNKAFIDTAALLADRLQTTATLLNRFHQAMLTAHPDIKEDALVYALSKGISAMSKTSGAILRAENNLKPLARTRAHLRSFHANLGRVLISGGAKSSNRPNTPWI